MLVLLVIVGICGAIAAWIVGYMPGGIILNIIVGVIGAYFGAFLDSLIPFDLPIVSAFTIVVERIQFNLIWAVIGSILLLLLLNSLRRGNGHFFVWQR